MKLKLLNKHSTCFENFDFKIINNVSVYSSWYQEFPSFSSGGETDWKILHTSLQKADRETGDVKESSSTDQGTSLGSVILACFHYQILNMD